jgi:3-phosphoshikimate 1-carboxyvinyltransferase
VSSLFPEPGASLRISGGSPLRGVLRVPGDKSISHRALLLGALAEGTTVISGLAEGDDVARTASAVSALGADVGEGIVAGGRDRLHEPAGVLDVGNSGTTMRLLAGLCAGFDWLTVLTGDSSLSRRPMSRVAEPLRRMGANVDGREGGRLPPLVVRGGGLQGIDYELPVASAQVKSAVLLAALSARGRTVVRERVRTRAHTEEMLALFGADLAVSGDGLDLSVGPGPLVATAVDVPGDPSAAAFWVVAACAVPDSDITVRDVYLGPARADFLAVLQRMGADVRAVDGGLRARSGDLRCTSVGGSEVPGLIDEIPVLAVAAAVADGVTVFRDAEELRVKESDRVATMCEGMSAMGAKVEPTPDGMIVTGPSRLHGAEVWSHGDHRVAMALAVAAMAAEGESVVHGWEAVATSYPGFADEMARCRA